MSESEIYKKKFILFKRLIDKRFSDYKKKYCFNLVNETYQVQLILTDRIIILTILPDSEWYEFRKEIEKILHIFLIFHKQNLSVRFVLMQHIMFLIVNNVYLFYALIVLKKLK